MPTKEDFDTLDPHDFMNLVEAEHRAAKTPERDIIEHRRKCWRTDCNRTSRLEWCGWRYCFRHYWTNVLRDAGSWRHKLVKLRFTEIARH